MPLFGKNKNKGQEKSEKQPVGYPTQAAAPPAGPYPQQPAYAQQAYPAPQQAQPGYPAAGPQGAPPPYTPYAQPPAGYAPGPQQGPPPGAYWPPPQQTVVVQGGFDAGARFDGIAQPNIPPPPPGCAPNAAQMASVQGANVMVTQQRGDWLSGGSDGGYTWW